MESVRYPRIVADHFDSFEFVYPGNGGSNEGAIDWWMHCFTKEFPGHVLNGYKVPPNRSKRNFLCHFPINTMAKRSFSSSK